MLSSALSASGLRGGGGRIGAARDDDGEEEQGISLMDLVVISFICGGLFVSSGCNILLKNFLDTYLFRFEEEFSGFGITFFRFRGWGRGAE